jgi:CDP-paratose synthetase
MKILITGGTGYIGYNLTKYLSKKGYEIHLLIRSNSNLRDLKNYENVSIHPYNNTYDSVSTIFSRYKFDFIYHLAANFVKSNSLTDFELLDNVSIKLTNYLLSAALEQHQLIGFINIGTFSQLNSNYGNIYTLFKSYQEELCRFYSNKFGIRILSILLTDTYGKNDWRPKLLNQLNKSISENKPFHVNNPDAVLELIYIDDVCDALYHSLELLKSQQKYYEVYKLKGIEITTTNLIRLIQDLTGIDVNVTYGAEHHSEITERKKNTSVLPQWSPKLDLKTGIIRSFDLYKESLHK